MLWQHLHGTTWNFRKTFWFTGKHSMFAPCWISATLLYFIEWSIEFHTKPKTWLQCPTWCRISGFWIKIWKKKIEVSVGPISQPLLAFLIMFSLTREGIVSFQPVPSYSSPKGSHCENDQNGWTRWGRHCGWKSHMTEGPWSLVLPSATSALCSNTWAITYAVRVILFHLSYCDFSHLVQNWGMHFYFQNW
jgi:hypothetical protein